MGLSTVGQGSKLVIDFEPYRAGIDEGELTTAKRLIKRASAVHKNLIDVVVYDAIACNSEWINTCFEAGLNTVVRVYEAHFDMKNGEKPLRFIKFLMKKPDGKRSQIMIVTTCMEMELRQCFA